MLSSPVISITNTFLPPNSPYSSSFLSLLPPSLSPQAALAAVIMVSINSLLSFSDLWEAFKHKKKDFIVMLVTLTITFVTETSTGLAVGTV
jgi:MFS superfamily sulfate permease-like transporter